MLEVRLIAINVDRVMSVTFGEKVTSLDVERQFRSVPMVVGPSSDNVTVQVPSHRSGEEKKDSSPQYNATLSHTRFRIVDYKEYGKKNEFVNRH